jgi:putative tricarboxylic transport membrane protein
MTNLVDGLHMLADPIVLLYMVIGVVLGLIFGALPGLTAPMVLGLAIPFTFGMHPIEALLFLLGLNFGTMYGGSITAILINTPGTPAGAASALDGYPLTLQGKSNKALQMSALSAFAGALLSILSLVIFAPLLSKVALKFGPSEYFAIGLMGLSIVIGVAGKSISRAIISALLGLLLALVGTDPLTGAERFTFGNIFLSDGILSVPALVGLFAVTEILNQFVKGGSKSGNKVMSGVMGPGLTWEEIRKSLKTMFKGGIIGVVIGALPGVGAVISSFFSYNEAVRSSKEPETYGKGNLDGVAAAESGAIGTEAASLIPVLTFGIPGDIGSAIILGAMILHGVHVGPELFSRSGDLVTALFIGILILEVIVLAAGWFGAGWVARLVRIPVQYLFPIITVLVVTGSFALLNDMFAVWETLAFGVLGFVLTRFHYPIVPLLIGLILGPIIENNFLIAMSASANHPMEFLTRPLTAGILLFSVISLIVSVRIHKKAQKRMEAGGPSASA